MTYKIGKNVEIEEKAKILLNQDLPTILKDKILMYNNLNKLLNEIFAHKEKWFNDATEYLEKYPLEKVSVYLEPTLEDIIEQVFKKQREMFSINK